MLIDLSGIRIQPQALAFGIKNEGVHWTYLWLNAVPNLSSTSNVKKVIKNDKSDWQEITQIEICFKQVQRIMEHAFQAYRFIGRSYEKNEPLSNHVEFQDKIKDLLNELKRRLHVSEEILVNCKKDKSNEMLIQHLNEEWKACKSSIQEKINKIQINADKLKVTLSNLKFEIYPKEEGPSCFISYSWGDDANVRLVHRIARDLKRVGINVKLDIWDNTTGSIEAFIECIHEVDYIIVIGTPDLVEKWKNFTSSGASRGKIGSDYKGNVVAKELKKILGRLGNRPDNNHGIINLLLYGGILA